MSIEDLKAGTFTTQALKDGIEEGLVNIERIAVADKEHGRLDQAQKKQWLVDAVREYIRMVDNELAGRRALEFARTHQTPMDSVRHSER
jgi:hypothetical protein